MAKKSENQKSNKEHSSKEGRERNQPGKNRSDNSNERGQKMSGKMGSGNSKGRGAKGRGINMAQGNNELADDINKLVGNNKSKNGCFPKLFMLLIPIMAAGSYFILK